MRHFTDEQIRKRVTRFLELEAKGLVVRHPMPNGGSRLTFPHGEDHPEVAVYQAEAEALNSTVH